MSNPFGPDSGSDSSRRTPPEHNRSRSPEGAGDSPWPGFQPEQPTGSPFAPAPTPAAPFTPSSPGAQLGTAPSPASGTSRPAAVLTATSGPWGYLIAALVTAILGIVLGVAAWLGFTATETTFLTLAGLGWVCAGIATFILLGLHVMADTKRQTSGLYISNPTQKLLQYAAMGLGVIGVIITAVEIALWFGKAFGA